LTIEVPFADLGVLDEIPGAYNSIEAVMKNLSHKFTRMNTDQSLSV